MRGEHELTVANCRGRKGSSPHARGAPSVPPRFAPFRGIIPACAGSTLRPQNLPAPRGDHPRMRGEHWMGHPALCGSMGSSPHARGAPVIGTETAPPAGIIPACAGSTAAEGLGWEPVWDHPRMRGEHQLKGGLSYELGGSSPHARGARRRTSSPRPFGRIIPACAGSTNARCRVWMSYGDHPRMRGEHPLHRGKSLRGRGSSPHARGARKRSTRECCECGIIPACAGSTFGHFAAGHSDGDHPRMRGEHSWGRLQTTSLLGSSPHARGAHQTIKRRGRGVGIIPACAGSTRPPILSIRYRRDHPRMRGEHRRIASSAKASRGARLSAC